MKCYSLAHIKNSRKCGRLWPSISLSVEWYVRMWPGRPVWPRWPWVLQKEPSPVPLWKAAIMRNSVFPWIPAPLWQLPAMLSFSFSLSLCPSLFLKHQREQKMMCITETVILSNNETYCDCSTWLIKWQGTSQLRKIWNVARNIWFKHLYYVKGAVVVIWRIWAS